MSDDAIDAEMVDGIEDGLQTIKKFLLKARGSAENEEGLDIVLSQYGKTKAEEDAISVFPFGFDTDVDELAEEILNAAIDDVEGMKGKKQKYSVKAEGLAFRGTFTLKYDDGEDEDLDDIEDNPNRKGLMGMLMRHQQGVYKLSVAGAKETIDMLIEQLKAKDEIILKLQGQAIETIKQFEELVSGRHVRDLEIRRIERKEERMDKLAGTVMTGFPILMSKFIGGGAGAARLQEMPGARTPLEAMLEAFVKSMNQEQLSAIMGSGLLNPEQLAGLVEMIKFMIARQEEEEKQQAAKNGASQAAANGQSPANPQAQP